MLFPITDPQLYEQASKIDFETTNWSSCSDYDFCYFASGFWAWSEDKTASKLMGVFSDAVYHYTVSSRINNTPFFGLACHGSARDVLSTSNSRVLIPLRYFGLTSGNSGNLKQITPEFLKNFKSTKPKKIKDTYTFEDYLRFYNWYLSEENPIYRLILPMTSIFEVFRTPEGYPIGFSIKMKSVSNQHIIGLFLCQSRFLSECFAHRSLKTRFKWYNKLKDKLPNHLLYPIVAYLATVNHSHDWFKSSYSISLQRWLKADYDRNSPYWCTLFSGDDLGIRLFENNIPDFLKQKGFL